MGQLAQTEKDMTEISSPLKPRESLMAIEVSIKENISLADVIKLREKGHWKKLAREKNQTQHSDSKA